MTQFMGTFTSRLDAKGRVSIPAPFRAALREASEAGELVLRPSHKHTSIEAWPKAAFEALKFSLEITEVHECVDPDKLVVEYVSQGRVEATGKTYANRYIGVYWFRDGAICRVREFYDALISSQVMSDH